MKSFMGVEIVIKSQDYTYGRREYKGTWQK